MVSILFRPPPYKPKPNPMWATYIYDRTPRWKVHNDRGKAHNAVYYKLYSGPRGGVIYKLVDNEWTEDERVEGTGGARGAAVPGECAECGRQVWEEDYLCARCRVDKDR